MSVKRVCAPKSLEHPPSRPCELDDEVDEKVDAPSTKKEGETVSKDRRGSIVQRDGKLYARVQLTGEGGRQRDLWRKAESRARAREIIRELLGGIGPNGTSAFDNSKLTFADSCDYHRDNHLTEARYVSGIKASGLRSLRTPKYQLNALRAFFGRVRLRDLNYEHLRSYKGARLSTEKRVGRTLSVASVNRELAVLRKMLNVTRAARWIQSNPFHGGNSLISAAAERRRTVVLLREGEERLLAACTGRRKHLRAFIICAVDSGCRKGELLSARWKEINSGRREWFIPMMNTKTARARTVPVGSRVLVELRRLWEAAGCDSEALAFGIRDVKRAFDGARRGAGCRPSASTTCATLSPAALAQNHVPGCGSGMVDGLPGVGVRGDGWPCSLILFGPPALTSSTATMSGADSPRGWWPSLPILLA